MLRRALLLALASITLFVGTGCGSTLVPFTQDLRGKSGLTADELKNLQYYISRKVTLRRELESGGKEITGAHTLVIVSGKRIEEVVIEEQTPGVAVAVGPNSLAVSFEPGESMVFTTEDGPRVAEVRGQFAEAPNPFPANDGPRADEPNPFPNTFGGRYALVTDSVRSVTYEGKRFDVVGESREAVLLIDAKSLERVSTTRKVMPGMKLNPSSAR